MKIVDENGIEIKYFDHTKGYLKKAVETVYHEAVKGVEEQWHYETIAEYPNGGKDIRKVIDVPGSEAREAWEEEIPFFQYVPYTPEELAKMEASRKTSLEEQIAELQEAFAMILSGVTE